jgi:hypothetical protein
MEAICSSKTSVETQRTIWRYIPEIDTLQLILLQFKHIFLIYLDIFYNLHPPLTSKDVIILNKNWEGSESDPVAF